MSLHKSKGLTADLVVVMGCVQGLVPTLPDPKKSKHQEQVPALEEQRRLFYVSITRARQILVLSSVTGLPRDLAYQMGVEFRGRGNVARTSTSQFIEELGPSRPKAIREEDLLRMASKP
jgi:superfamily I DNA/RNA helicase